MAKLADPVVIDGKSYPCDEWNNVEQGKPASVSWNEGIPDGIGQTHLKSLTRCYYARHFDTTLPPFLRLPPPITAITSFTNFDVSSPFYVIATTTADSQAVEYIFNGAYVWKLRRTTNVYDTQYTGAGVSRASCVYGRPVFFDGSWRIPRGESLDAVTLTPGNIDTGTETTELHNNTITTNVKASHFGTIQDQLGNYILRAFKSSAESKARRIEKAATATAFTASPGNTGTEVGDDSFGITDILTAGGEALIMKPDGPYRFDPDGNALPVQDFVHATGATSTTSSANSIGHSAYAYWCHTTGIYLIFRDVVKPLGLESDLNFHVITTGDFDTLTYYQSGFASGRWLYVIRRTQLYQAYINDDGSLIWYGPLYIAGTNSPMHLAGDSIGPDLWFVASGESNLYRMSLQADGSTRAALDASLRGYASQSPEILMSQWDAGRPDRLKQLRKFWFRVRDTSGESLQPIVKRDGAANQNWGSARTTTGFFENMATTMGTNDTFRYLQLGFTVSGHGSGEGPLIEAWGVEAVAASVYRVIIPLTNAEVQGGSQGIVGSLDNLRTLKHGQGVEVKAPGRNGTALMHVLGVREKTIRAEQNAPEYEVTVFLEGWNLEDGTN